MQKLCKYPNLCRVCCRFQLKDSQSLGMGPSAMSHGGACSWMDVLAAHAGLQGQRIAAFNSYAFIYKLRQNITCQ